MKSIRLSLLVYFLVLLSVALGTVSILVYRSAQEALADKSRATKELIERQHQDQRAKARTRLDESLLADAKVLAREAQIHVDPDAPTLSWDAIPGLRRNAPRQPYIIGCSICAIPLEGLVPTAVWTMQSVNTLAGLQRWPVTAIKFEDENETHSDDPPVAASSVADYLQIQTVTTPGFPNFFSLPATYRSRSLDGHSLALSQEVLSTHEYLGPETRDFQLDSGITVRRVMIRYNLAVAHQQTPSTVGPPAKPPDKPSFSGRGQFRVWGTVFAAYSSDRLEEADAPLRAQRDRDLAEAEQRTEASLKDLRNRLLFVALASFAAVVVGVYFLVRLGLMPLHRLSDAVSQVSERDFRLPFDQRRLPSELKPIVERLQLALDQLRRAFEREKQAAADISHELRTPVAALLTTIEVTLKKQRRPEEYREALEDCRASGLQVQHLVERLLKLARIDAGVDLLRPEPVDVSDLAEQCAAIVRPLAEARGLTLRLHCEGEAVVNADPAKLREVITNLLHNAVEYNRPDGSIDLTVERHNGTLCVEVRDTGIGIAPEDRARLFERFYRADPSRQSEGLHAGLGLAIVKGYVDLMGGSIRVDSTLGEGSAFRVELPVASQLEQSIRPEVYSHR
jgi:signal transduction histidine kinase